MVKFENKLYFECLSIYSKYTSTAVMYYVECRGTKRNRIDTKYVWHVNMSSENMKNVVIAIINGRQQGKSMAPRLTSRGVKCLSTAVFQPRTSLEVLLFVTKSQPGFLCTLFLVISFTVVHILKTRNVRCSIARA